MSIRHLSIISVLSGFLVMHASPSAADTSRWERDLSGPGWRLWLDRAAEWKQDDIHLPPVEISSLTVNPPTCGWDHLPSSADTLSCVPGTVEEYFWSRNGNPNGIAGDYRGVSWWSTTFELPAKLRGKRIELAFESVNLRAEVFVNRTLAGYDVIGNTPFDCDITTAVRFGETNTLDIRITDPAGTFSWNDENLLRWGENLIPSIHGFGGITGNVIVRAIGPAAIRDIYVQNSPDPRKVSVFATVTGTNSTSVPGVLTLGVHPAGDPSKVLWRGKKNLTAGPDGTIVEFAVNVPNAALWDIGKPNLYVATARFEDSDGTFIDESDQRFGFRWFTVGEKNGDLRFYLNERRVFIFAAMTRGFWPKNGIFPTPEMARRDMEAAVSLGLNMMLYHRAIGQLRSIEAADEMGVLTYEEPGGYLCRPGPTPEAQAWRSEKLRRMVVRDRSHPSMVIFNLDDLSSGPPTDTDIANIRRVHELDPSRICTYNCIIAPKIPQVRDDPMKLRMLPFDDTLHYHGWTAPYHLIRYGCWQDEYYRNPRYYLRYVMDPVATMGDSINPLPEDEIIFFGEEGAIGAPVRLEKIRNELYRSGADGWRETEHIAWYEAYDRFLDEYGMRSSFPTVDNFTLALGKNIHYFHGRALENVRISNKADAYVLNGWGSASTHTDFVDAYRNPTGNPDIIRHYVQPCYVAVKLRATVMPTGYSTAADIFLVNETNLKGKYTLNLALEGPDSDLLWTGTKTVTVRGGENYGQLLVENVVLPPIVIHGYHTLRAELSDKKTVKATGFDKMFVVDLTGSGITGTVAVIDTSGAINRFLAETRGMTLPAFDPADPDIDCLVLGAQDTNVMRRLGIAPGMRPLDPILDRVLNGMTLVVLSDDEGWARRMTNAEYPAVSFLGSASLGNRGRLFVGKDTILHGLPQSEGMDWEYQVFHRGSVRGLRFGPTGVGMIAGAASEQNAEVLHVLSRIPFGEGEILVTTLDILGELSSEAPQSAIAKRLFLNLIERGHSGGLPAAR